MYPTLFTTPGVKAFAEAVDTERQAQLAKWGDQHHPDGTGGAFFAERAERARRACQDAASKGQVTWRHILEEEFKEATAETDPAKLRTELIQCGAVIAAWFADLDSRPAAPPDADARSGVVSAPSAGALGGRVAASSAQSRLDRIAEAHSKHATAGGMTSGDCNECGWSWPCPTWTWATTDRDPLATWNPDDDEEADQ